MDDQFELETLEIGEDFEEVEKLFNQHGYKFPAVCITNKSIYFNRYASNAMGNLSHVKYLLTKNHLVVEKVDPETDNAFAARRGNGKSYGKTYVTTYPAFLHNRGVRSGVYRLYKAGNRFAIKRYEPLENPRETA